MQLKNFYRDFEILEECTNPLHFLSPRSYYYEIKEFSIADKK